MYMELGPGAVVVGAVGLIEHAKSGADNPRTTICLPMALILELVPFTNNSLWLFVTSRRLAGSRRSKATATWVGTGLYGCKYLLDNCL
jgi:hypothetical protein